jgi:hypothetical protein
MNLQSTYTVKHKEQPIVWEFKYDLKGNLLSFKVEDQPLSKSQIDFLFFNNKFPFTEIIMKTIWMTSKKSVFEITINAPEINFETFYKSYKHPIKKTMASRAWEKLSKKDQMDALAHIEVYDKFLTRKYQAKAAPSTYLNQRYWEDNHGSIH